jgi:hypothetical protein
MLLIAKNIRCMGLFQEFLGYPPWGGALIDAALKGQWEVAIPQMHDEAGSLSSRSRISTETIRMMMSSCPSELCRKAL